MEPLRHSSTDPLDTKLQSVQFDASPKPANDMHLGGIFWFSKWIDSINAFSAPNIRIWIWILVWSGSYFNQKAVFVSPGKHWEKEPRCTVEMSAVSVWCVNSDSFLDLCLVTSLLDVFSDVILGVVVQSCCGTWSGIDLPERIFLVNCYFWSKAQITVIYL